MKFTNAEKLMLLLLCDIADGEKEADPSFIRDAIITDNTWALHWKLGGIPFDRTEPDDENPKHVNETADILTMYRSLEHSFSVLSADDKAKVLATDRGFLYEFRGFDGNNEGEYLSAMSFMVNQLDRFDSFKGRENHNSHAPSLYRHRKMLNSWRTNYKSETLGVDALISLLNEPD